jgi:hypothetical protein
LTNAEVGSITSFHVTSQASQKFDWLACGKWTMTEHIKKIIQFLLLIRDPAFVVSVLLLSLGFLRYQQMPFGIAIAKKCAMLHLDLFSKVVAAFVCLAFAGAAVIYLFYPNYLDHTEPLMAATSWLGSEGQPMYPLWEKGQGLYGDLYGPAQYEMTELGLWISPTIFGSKIVGLAMAALGFIFQILTIRKGCLLLLSRLLRIPRTC